MSGRATWCLTGTAFRPLQLTSGLPFLNVENSVWLPVRPEWRGPTKDGGKASSRLLAPRRPRRNHGNLRGVSRHWSGCPTVQHPLGTDPAHQHLGKLHLELECVECRAKLCGWVGGYFEVNPRELPNKGIRIFLEYAEYVTDGAE